MKEAPTSIRVSDFEDVTKEAAYELGLMLCSPNGGEINYEEALTYFNAAAERGHVDAACEAARVYRKGCHFAAKHLPQCKVPEDPKRAYELYSRKL